MIDQLIIGDKASYDDYSASLATRAIGQPKKKTIKETVPYSNATYDFSAINGELYWEERELEYVFEMTAETPEELEEMKAAFADWVMNVMEEKIFDPFIPDYHFVGTFDDIEFDDDEGLDKTTVSVRFTAYPYKIANYAKEYTYTVEPNSSLTIHIENASSHRVIPTITVSDAGITLGYGNLRWYIPQGTVKYDFFMLEKGINEFSCQNTTAINSTVTFSIIEEVL